MPAIEQLGTPNSLTGWRSSRRAGLPMFLGRMIVPIAAIAAVLMIALATTLAALSGGDRNRCEPAGAAVRAGYAATCVPLGSGGDQWLPDLRPLNGH